MRGPREGHERAVLFGVLHWREVLESFSVTKGWKKTLQSFVVISFVSDSC
jgi:hypothetical protein